MIIIIIEFTLLIALLLSIIYFLGKKKNQTVSEEGIKKTNSITTIYGFTMFGFIFLDNTLKLSENYYYLTQGILILFMIFGMLLLFFGKRKV